MRTDTRDLISVSEAGRTFGRIVSQVTDDNRPRVVIKNSAAAVAIVPMEMMDRLSRLDELEKDLRSLVVATARTLADSGARHNLTDVAAALGVDLSAED